MSRPTPTTLLILDGWGNAEPGPGNALSLAETPNLDRILKRYPRTDLQCSGRAVGLPEGFMGNSEVGHMNIGAGRVVYQDMTRVDLAIEDGSLGKNQALLELLGQTRARGGRLHFMGLVSDGGVHSHVRHLHALLRLAKEHGVPALVHCFLDGRDTPPKSGKGYVADLAAFLDELQWGHIASLMGRYYAMDRDKRWERNALAHAALTAGRGELVEDPVSGVQQAYDAGQNDEFVKPRVVAEQGDPVGVLRDGDGLFFCDFRADRARQISRSLFQADFDKFEREAVPELAGFVTMTRYEAGFPMPVAFPPQNVSQTLGEVVSGMGLEQLRIAETEKYAHVTYFLNCGREEPFPGEERVLIPSPREVPTYDHKPEMSCPEVAERFVREWESGRYTLAVCNLANMDMVGHTGIIEAAVKAAETVDAAVGRIVEAVLSSGGRVLLTADHGNAEEMLDAQGETQTAHSTNTVPFVLVDDSLDSASLRAGGKLGDMAPTILALWKAERPTVMDGEPLVLKGEGA
jgi:2,3-bisphosphoglycerate-independent phosphoglycerate mutase